MFTVTQVGSWPRSGDLLRALRDKQKGRMTASEFDTVADGEVEVSSRTMDDRAWIVTCLMDDGPVRYYRYDRGAPGAADRSAAFLFTNRQDLEGVPLA